MIAYMDQPLRATWSLNGHDIVVVALYYEGGHVGAVFIDQDGSMGQAALSEINVNWRFNDRTRKWTDVDTGEDLGGDDDGDGD